MTEPAVEKVSSGEGTSEPPAPLFSVIMPVYDKVRHVEDAIRSVLGQTLTDFELIVVDDASTDGSREVVEAIADPRLRHFRRDKPGPGGYAARNLGIAHARGEWVTFLDADDTWVATRLDELQEAIGVFPDCTIHACAWFVATRDGRRHVNRYARRHGSRGRHLVTFDAYLEALRRNEPVIHTDTVAIRRTALQDADLFPSGKGLKRGGDVLAWLRLICRERRVAWSAEPGASYYVDSDNMVTRRVSGRGVSGLTTELLAPLEVDLSTRDRRRLRRAVNGLLWASWRNAAVTGKRVSWLPPRLFWRGTWWQAAGIALAASVPPAAYRALLRLRRFSSRAG